MLQGKKISYLALFTAFCVVGRLTFHVIPNVQPMTTLFLILVFQESFKESLLVATLSLLITNLYLGMGPWIIPQFLAYGGILTFAYFLKKARAPFWLQAFYSFLAGFIYGFIVSFFMQFIFGIKAFWPYYFQGLPYDFLHALGNFGFYLILAPIFKRLKKRFSY